MSNSKGMMEYIVKKLDKMDVKLDAVHEQALLTNGRVTRLEKDSVGRWVKNNLWKAFILIVMFFTIVISDFRHPIIEWILKLI